MDKNLLEYQHFMSDLTQHLAEKVKEFNLLTLPIVHYLISTLREGIHIFVDGVVYKPIGDRACVGLQATSDGNQG